MKSILVIDDEESLRVALRQNLQSSGYNVIDASGIRQALHQLACTPTELILIDIFMPGVESLQAIRELRQSYPNIPIIAMSGGGSKGLADVLNVAKLLLNTHCSNPSQGWN